MACPDPEAIAKLDTPDGDPELISHLRQCPSCWLDWQVVHGARHALSPPGEVRHDLNARVMARINRQAREQGRPTAWWEYGISGLLVSAASGVFVLARPGEPFVVTITTVLWCVVLSAIAAAVFFWRQETSEHRIGSGAL